MSSKWCIAVNTVFCSLTAQINVFKVSMLQKLSFCECVVYTWTKPSWWYIAPHLARVMKWAHCLWARTECHTVVVYLPEFHLKPCWTFKKESSFIGRACTGVIRHRTGDRWWILVDTAIKKNYRFLNKLGISWAVSVVASQERIFTYLVIAVICFLTCDVVFICPLILFLCLPLCYYPSTRHV